MLFVMVTLDMEHESTIAVLVPCEPGANLFYQSVM